MKIGIFGGAVNDGTVDDVVAEARAAEQDGFASYWAPNIFGHDALTALAIVGREVPRIELGTSVVPTYPRHPHAIAQQCHTVAAASGNRLTLGIGLSHKVVIENMLGMSYDKPVRHLREYLSVLMPLSRNEPAKFRGETYSVHGGISAKGSNGFGVVVAALGEQMLRVTAALADGTLTWCTGPATLAGHTIPPSQKQQMNWVAQPHASLRRFPCASLPIKRPRQNVLPRFLLCTERFLVIAPCSTKKAQLAQPILQSPAQSVKYKTVWQLLQR